MPFAFFAIYFVGGGGGGGGGLNEEERRKRIMFWGAFFCVCVCVYVYFYVISSVRNLCCVCCDSAIMPGESGGLK